MARSSTRHRVNRDVIIRSRPRSSSLCDDEKAKRFTITPRHTVHMLTRNACSRYGDYTHVELAEWNVQLKGDVPHAFYADINSVCDVSTNTEKPVAFLPPAYSYWWQVTVEGNLLLVPGHKSVNHRRVAHIEAAVNIIETACQTSSGLPPRLQALG